MAPPTPLPSFTGKVYLRGTPGYNAVCPQYASLNHTGDQSMQPYAIIRPAGDEDVKAALSWARQNKVAVAVRTGGHQYSGASSTFGNNIQLDLCNTYTDIDWLDSTTLQVGVSRKLLSLNEELRAKNAFVPHGQCSHVNIGGHCHTGGYGLPGRAFGLFGDHIIAIRVITADAKDGSCSDARWIERGAQDPQEAELFWAVLGGSPGNFAILTDIRLKVHDGSLYPKARGIKLTGAFTEGAYKALLEIKAKMAADPDLPADYDFCITVLSGPSENDSDTVSRFPDSSDASAAAAAAIAPTAGSGGADVTPHRPPVEKFGMMSGDDYAAFLKTDAGKLILDMNQEEFMAHAKSKAAAVDPQPTNIVPVPVIIVFAEWANIGGAAQSDAGVVEWLQNIRASFPQNPITGNPLLFTDEAWGPDTPDNGQPRGMPFLTSQWVFPLKREYDGMPYDKRTYSTTATNLDASGWVDFTVQTTKDLAWAFPPPFGTGNCVAVQIQHYGGNQSRFKTNDPDRKQTSYSWRDTTVVMTMDAFYPPNSTSQEAAKAWQAANDTAYKGPAGNFSRGQDRRLLWASYEAQGTDELNLSKYWHFYHEDQAKWTRLQTIKSRVDPDNVLTPNQFAVTPLGQ